MATARVQQTITTSTTASVLVINTGYLKTRLGLLKFCVLIFSLIIFVCLIINIDWHFHRNHFLFLLLINFSHLYVITLMLISSLLSLSTASLLPKITFDFIFHFTATILYLAAGLWSISFALDYGPTSYKIAAALAFLVALLHVIHGYFSYHSCRIR